MSLLAPLTFRCGATAPNRAVLAPLTNQQSGDDGVISPDEHAWLVRRAAGGFGIVTTCAAHVAPDGQGFPGQLGVWGDHQLPGLAALASAIAAHGSLGLVQLHHGGARAPSRLTGRQPWSASAFVEDRPGFEVPRAATEEDVLRTIRAFAEAARRAARAGFAGVELHGAHGYLLGQFLSTVMNTRDDRWGGALDGRARLIREVTRAVRAAVPVSFVVGVRLSPEDFGQARGLDLDETVQVAAWLADDGVDYVHLSLWDGKRMTTKRPAEHPVPIFRRAVPAEVRLVAAGKVWTRDDAEALAALGVDLVAVGRAAIVDPDWPRHVLAAGAEPRRPPRTPDEYAAVAVGPRFVEYLRGFKGMVAA